jgi:regulator of sigma E protease
MFILPLLISLFFVVVTILIMLGIIVMIHEFGHFIVARKAGVLVEEFGIGMPPRVYGMQKIENVWHHVRGPKAPRNIEHTLYSINSLPIGGFVRLYGDGAGGEGGEIDARLATRAFDNAGVWWRAAIMIAGVAMNILLAVIIYYILLSKNGFTSERLPLIGNPTFAFGTIERSIGISNIVRDSPAQKSGLRAEDIILEVRPHTSANLWIQMKKPNDLISIVKANNGVPVDIHVKDFTSSRERVVTVEPVFNEKEKRAMIGAGLMDFVTIRYDRGYERYLAGWLHSWNIASYNFQALGTMISYAITEKKPEIIGETVTGPVGIGVVIDKILKGSGERTLDNLLNLMAIISLSLAVVNILPLPALDGGRLLLLAPEMLTGRKINKKFEQYVNVVGFIFLIGLSVLITIKDVIRLW